MSGREQTGRGWRTFWPLLLPVAAYELACFVLLITRGQYLYFMMGWNVFLALLPLVFVSIAETVRRRWLTGCPGGFVDFVFAQCVLPADRSHPCPQRDEYRRSWRRDLQHQYTSMDSAAGHRRRGRDGHIDGTGIPSPGAGMAGQCPRFTVLLVRGGSGVAVMRGGDLYRAVLAFQQLGCIEYSLYCREDDGGIQLVHGSVYRPFYLYNFCPIRIL